MGALGSDAAIEAADVVKMCIRDRRLTAVVAALGAVIMMGSDAYCAEVKDAQYYFKQGNDIEWKNNRLGAIDSYTEALKLNPDYVEARVARGKLYYFTGQYAKALEDFNYFYNKPNYGPTCLLYTSSTASSSSTSKSTELNIDLSFVSSVPESLPSLSTSK